MTRPNASPSLNSQVFRAQGTTVLGAPFLESALLRCHSRSHLNGLHIYDPDTFRIVRLTSTRLHSAIPQRRPESSLFWLVGYTESAGLNRHVVGDERALQERK